MVRAPITYTLGHTTVTSLAGYTAPLAHSVTRPTSFSPSPPTTRPPCTTKSAPASSSRPCDIICTVIAVRGKRRGKGKKTGSGVIRKRNGTDELEHESRRRAKSSVNQNSKRCRVKLLSVCDLHGGERPAYMHVEQPSVGQVIG